MKSSPVTDVRDTVNYKEVMKQYGLGPNGGIVTALNLFSTKFGQVVELIEKAGKKHKYCVIDTPGTEYYSRIDTFLEYY